MVEEATSPEVLPQQWVLTYHTERPRKRDAQRLAILKNQLAPGATQDSRYAELQSLELAEREPMRRVAVSLWWQKSGVYRYAVDSGEPNHAFNDGARRGDEYWAMGPRSLSLFRSTDEIDVRGVASFSNTIFMETRLLRWGGFGLCHEPTKVVITNAPRPNEYHATIENQYGVKARVSFAWDAATSRGTPLWATIIASANPDLFNGRTYTFEEWIATDGDAGMIASRVVDVSPAGDAEATIAFDSLSPIDAQSLTTLLADPSPENPDLHRGKLGATRTSGSRGTPQSPTRATNVQIPPNAPASVPVQGLSAPWVIVLIGGAVLITIGVAMRLIAHRRSRSS